MRDRGPEFFEYRDVVLSQVDSSKRVAALYLIRRCLGCSPAEAKEQLSTLPVTLAQRLPRSDLETWEKIHATPELALEFPVVFQEPNPHYGPIQADRLFGASKPQTGSDPLDMSLLSIDGLLTDGNSIDLTIQRCSHCSAIGSLKTEYEATQVCPKCHELGLSVKTCWIT